jgi:hypothetical protein
MGAAIGAALKKLAVAIFTNPKVLKTVVGIIIGIIVIICMPIIAVVPIFNGSMDIDTDRPTICNNYKLRKQGRKTAVVSRP